MKAILKTLGFFGPPSTYFQQNMCWVIRKLPSLLCWIKFNYMTKPRTKAYSDSLALEEAREAVVKLKTLKPLLSPKDEETLAILIDKQLMGHLEKSLSEEARGKVEPLKNILK